MSKKVALGLILRRVKTLAYDSTEKTEVIEHPGEIKSTTRLETYKYDVTSADKKTGIYTHILTNDMAKFSLPEKKNAAKPLS